MRYARVLLEHCSEDTRQLFIDYYTGQYRPKRDIIKPDTTVVQGSASSAIQSLASFLPLPYLNAGTATSSGVPKDEPSQGAPKETQEDEQSIQYSVPKPRTAFSSFVDHPDDFIVFLEACSQGGKMEEEESVDLYTTLFEMYLHKANEKRGEEREMWEAKAKKLIEGGDVRSTSLTLPVGANSTGTHRHFQPAAPIASFEFPRRYDPGA